MAGLGSVNTCIISISFSNLQKEGACGLMRVNAARSRFVAAVAVPRVSACVRPVPSVRGTWL